MDEAKIQHRRWYSEIRNARRAFRLVDIEYLDLDRVRPGAQGKESENWHVPVRNDDDVGAAEQLIDSLGGCRPRLTSPPGALLLFPLLQLHFLTQFDALAGTGERSATTLLSGCTDRSSRDRVSLAAPSPRLLSRRGFPDRSSGRRPRITLTRNSRWPEGIPDATRRVALLHNKYRINHSKYFANISRDAITVLNGASVRSQLPTGGRYHSDETSERNVAIGASLY